MLGTPDRPRTVLPSLPQAAAPGAERREPAQNRCMHGPDHATTFSIPGNRSRQQEAGHVHMRWKSGSFRGGAAVRSPKIVKPSAESQGY